MKTDKAAEKISRMILRLQATFARLMTKLTSGWPVPRLKMALAMVCTLLVILSGWSIMDSFNHRVFPAAKVIHFRINRAIHEAERQPVFVTLDSYKRMQSFRKYLDSLRTDVDGQKIYDSITLLRPYLMDSINEVEKMYLSQ